MVGKKESEADSGKGYQYPRSNQDRRGTGQHQGNGIQVFHQSGHDRIHFRYDRAAGEAGADQERTGYR